MNRPSYKKLYEDASKRNYKNEMAIKDIVKIIKEKFNINIKLEYTEACLEKCITIKENDLQIFVRTGILGDEFNEYNK